MYFYACEYFDAAAEIARRCKPVDIPDIYIMFHYA